MITQGFNNYSDDILDIIPLYRSYAYTEALWETAIHHDENSLKSATFKNLSDYAIIRQNLPQFKGCLRGEFGKYDNTNVTNFEYLIAKLAQRVAVNTTSHRGYGFLSSALSTVVKRHSVEVGISFLKKAWADRFIVLPSQFYEFLWVLIRCQAFNIDFETSYSEYRNALAKTDSGTLLNNLAKINSKQSRKHQCLLKFYNNLKLETEANLLRAKTSTDISLWIRNIRDLYPQYFAMQRIAEEAYSMVSDGAEKNEIDALARFADERRADIGTILTSYTPVPYLQHIADALPNKTKAMQRAKYYYRGRITFPEFVLKEIMISFEDNVFNVSNLSCNLAKQLSPGHALVYKKRDEYVKTILCESIDFIKNAFDESVIEYLKPVENFLLRPCSEKQLLIAENVFDNFLFNVDIESSIFTIMNVLKRVCLDGVRENKEFNYTVLSFIVWPIGAAISDSYFKNGYEMGLMTLLEATNIDEVSVVDIYDILSVPHFNHVDGIALKFLIVTLFNKFNKDNRITGVNNNYLLLALYIFVKELRKEPTCRRPHSILQSWGYIFGKLRSVIETQRELSLISYIMLSVLFTHEELELFNIA